MASRMILRLRGQFALPYSHVGRMRRMAWTLSAALAGRRLLGIAAAHAQQIWAGGYGRMPPRFATPASFQGGFNFCRLMFTSDHREKQGWSTDYPGADINFSIRVSELTKINVTMRDDSSEGPEPDAVVVRLTDDALVPVSVRVDAGCRHGEVQPPRSRRGCRTICSRADSCWPPTITAAGRSSNSTTRSRACCRRAAFRSSI